MERKEGQINRDTEKKQMERDRRERKRMKKKESNLVKRKELTIKFVVCISEGHKGILSMLLSYRDTIRN